MNTTEDCPYLDIASASEIRTVIIKPLTETAIKYRARQMIMRKALVLGWIVLPIL